MSKPKTSENKGFICPDCGSKTSVRWTRTREKTVVRGRNCPACERSFSTTEKINGEPAIPEDYISVTDLEKNVTTLLESFKKDPTRIPGQIPG